MMLSQRRLPSGQLLFYLRDVIQTNWVVLQFHQCLKGPLGFDIEYKPNFAKGSRPNRTALVQLASESIVLLVQVSAMSEFPHTIRDIIQDPNIIKAGVAIKDDVLKLWREFDINASQCLELSHLARAVDQARWPRPKERIGLARLALAYQGRPMSKQKRVQLSNWELPLTQEQQDYAADDAIVGLSVLQKLYTMLPSVRPSPAESSYLFSLSNGIVISSSRTSSSAGPSNSISL